MSHVALKEILKSTSELFDSDNDMPTYQLPLTITTDHSEELIQKISIGLPLTGQPVAEKVILLVGATGTGKSTFINGLVNYVFGVEWGDSFRFRLVRESTYFAAQSQSQTRYVTVYSLHHNQEMKAPYTLTIIDTPGFGDTGGIDRDKEITKAVTGLFTNPEYGIDHIDIVGFVVQSSLARLTPTQKYIYDSILSLFGKDIAENIFLLITFSDSQKPPVLASVREAHVPFHTSLRFNNGALYASNNSDDDEFDQIFWRMGLKSFEKLVTALANIESKSLYLTREVLNERRQLEVYVTGIQEGIQEGLNKLEQYRQEVTVVQWHEADIKRNRDFNYTVMEQTMVHQDLEPGQHVTNCLTCNKTCHYLCALPNDEQKQSCVVMNKSGYCKVCDNRCHWSLHRNVPYRIVLQVVEVEKAADDLKKRYEKAIGEKMNAERLTEKILEDFYDLQMKVLYMTDEVRRGISRLNEIALRPNVLSLEQYLDILIKSEENEAHPGWQLRVDQLNHVKTQAQTLRRLAEDEHYDPFAEYRKMLKQAQGATAVKEFSPSKQIAENLKKTFPKTFDNAVQQALSSARSFEALDKI